MIHIKYFALFVILAFSIGFYCGLKFRSPSAASKSDSTVMLDKIKEVFKIINVEGQFSEIIQEKSYNYIDFSPFRKSIIIRANAKILVGFDLDTSKIFVDSRKKELKVTTDSSPKIISTDLNLDYYDIQQGTFNQFSPEELNALHDKVRDIIWRKADSSDLKNTSKRKRQELLHTLDQYFTILGWKLKVLDEHNNSLLLN